MSHLSATKSNVSRRVLSLLVALLFLSGLPTLFMAQNTAAGSISGIVQDSQGAVVPGAKVTALNRNQNAVNGVRDTDIAGVFAFNSLPAPATYTLTVEAAGFKKFTLTDVALTVSAQVGLPPFVLQVGSISESINVEANAVQLETVTATRSAVVSQQQVADLPVSTRTNVATAYLREVNGNPPDATGSFNGQRNSEGTVQLDGVTTMDAGNQGANFSYSMEAVGEVKVTTNAMGAEYGRSSGYNVAVALKSGSKDYHGSGYWYHRNEGLNANSWTNNFQGIQLPISRAMISGFTVGGPVWMPVGPLKKLGRNRVFFFTAFEFNPSKSNVVVTLTSPTAAQAAGNFAGVLNNASRPVVVTDPSANGAPFPGNVIPSNRFNRYGQALLNEIATLDPPNITGQPTYNYRSTLPILPSKVWNDTYRFDWNITQNNRVSFHLMRYHNNNPAYNWLNTGGNLNWSLYARPDGERSIALNFVSVLGPTTTNEFNVGNSKNYLPTGLPDTSSPYFKSVSTGWGSVPVLYSSADPAGLIPAFNFGSSGISNSPNFTPVGLPYVNEHPVRDYADNLTKLWGTHTLKAGFFIEAGVKHQTLNADVTGTYNFQVDSANSGDTGWAFSNALLGNYDIFTQASHYWTGDYHYRNYEWYLQDSWKARSNLTLNYGLRMALMPPWWEAGNLVSSFEPSLWDSSPAAKVALYQPYCSNGAATCSGSAYVARNPLTGATLPSAYIGTEVPGVGSRFNGMTVAGTNGLPRGLMDSRGIQWGPRLGFAWSPIAKTVVRGGGGVFYTRIEGNEIFYALSDPPNTVEAQLNYGNVSSVSGGTPLQPVSSSVAIARDGHVPTTYSFNLGIQRELPKNTLLDVSYVGTVSNHGMADVPYNATPLGSAWLPQNQNPTLPTTSSTILGANALPPNFYRPYLGVGGPNSTVINTGSTGQGQMISYNANSHYNALQVSVQHRTGKRLSIGANYAWSKAMGTTSVDFGALDPFHTRAVNYGPLSFDRTQYLNVDYVYNFPDAAKAGTFLDNIVGRILLNGWQLSGITGFAGGPPLTATYSYLNVASTVLNQEITGSADVSPRGVLLCNPVTTGPHTIQQYINTSCIAPASTGSIGADSGTGAFRGLGYRNWDAAMMKKMYLGRSETRYIAFRFEAYNVFNHTEWSSFNFTPTFNQATGAITNFQSYVPGQGGGWSGYGALNAVRAPRSVQLGARLTF